MLFAGRGIRLSTKMNSSGDNFSQNNSSGMSSGCETWQLELDNLEVYSKNFKSLECTFCSDLLRSLKLLDIGQNLLLTCDIYSDQISDEN